MSFDQYKKLNSSPISMHEQIAKQQSNVKDTVGRETTKEQDDGCTILR